MANVRVDNKEDIALEAAYRDNPLLKELDEANEKAKRWEHRCAQEVEGRAYDERRYSKELQELYAKMNNSVRTWIRFIYWGLFVPAWGLIGLALMVLPFVLYFIYHQRAEWFWLSPGGIVLLIWLGAYLDAEAEK